MGACLSCLGLGKDDSSSTNERAALLYDDEQRRVNYGTGQFDETSHLDNATIRREQEALDQICHAMSDNIIDVFRPAGALGLTQSKTERSSQEHSQSQQDGSASKAEMEMAQPFPNESAEFLRLATIKKGTKRPIFTATPQQDGGMKNVQQVLG